MIRFETLIEHYHDEIYHYLWRLLGGQDAAVQPEDVTQEVFMRAYRAFDSLRSDSNYRAWLYKIATNCAYTALNRRKRRALTLPEDDHNPLIADDGHGPLELVTQAEQMTALRGRIEALPPAQYSALVMRYMQELDYADIAEALDCSEESARANVSHALRRLRREFVEES